MPETGPSVGPPGVEGVVQSTTNDVNNNTARQRTRTCRIGFGYTASRPSSRSPPADRREEVAVSRAVEPPLTWHNEPVVHILTVLLVTLSACSFHRITQLVSQSPPSITSIRGDNGDRITDSVVIAGSGLDTVDSARLLDAAGGVLGALLISEAQASTLTAEIPTTLAVAIAAAPSQTFVVELTSAAGVARQTVQILRGEPGAKGDPGDSGPQGLAGSAGSTGDTGPQGLPGNAGNTGPQGLPGNTGQRGPTGPSGAIAAATCPGNNLVHGVDGTGALICVPELNVIAPSGITGSMIMNGAVSPEKLSSPFRYATDQFAVYGAAEFTVTKAPATTTATYVLTTDGNYGVLSTTGGSGTAATLIAPVRFPPGTLITRIECHINTGANGIFATLSSEGWNTVYVPTTHFSTNASAGTQITLTDSGSHSVLVNEKYMLILSFPAGTGADVWGCRITYR